MKIVVVGGSGLIGARLVTMLARDGHEVVATSRRAGVDAVTGEGLAKALSGAAVVVDVLNSPSFEDAAVMKFFRTSTHNVLAAEAAAGVRHHVALSVVGTARLLGNGYFRAKLAQEKLIKASSILYSIVQATQFFEFLTTVADAATHGTAIRVPPAHVQPIAADDVARALAKIATGSPLNGTVEIGGPELFYLDELLERVLGELGTIRFDEWLGQPAGAAGASSKRVPLKENEFRLSEVPAGSVLLIGDCAVFNIEGGFCATQAMCTHRQGPLSEGSLDGTTVTCPLHGAHFNVWTGAVLRGPAEEPLKTYRVTVDGEIGRVEIPIAHAIQGA